MNRKFWMVSAFTHEHLLGNPAGVFIVSNFPADAVMQAIAAQCNWSQIAFVQIISQENTFCHAHIRWFSPLDETRFCGHATLGSAYVLFTQQFTKHRRICFESLSGQLWATFHDNKTVTIDLPRKDIFTVPCPALLANALVDDKGNAVEIESVMRDEAIYVVTLKHPEDLMRLRPQLNLIVQLDTRAVSVTTRGIDGYDFQSRYFAPKVGIPEDPVCGSSHARLAPLWSQRLGNKKILKAYQASNRGGSLGITLTPDRVLLNGEAHDVLEGNLTLPLDQTHDIQNVA